MRKVTLFDYITVYYSVARRTHHKGSGAPAIVHLNSSTFPGSTKTAKTFFTPFLTAVLSQ